MADKWSQYEVKPQQMHTASERQEIGSIIKAGPIDLGGNAQKGLLERGNIDLNSQAIANYHKTGKHLGKFDTPENATAYSKKLWATQQKSLDEGKLTGSINDKWEQYAESSPKPEIIPPPKPKSLVSRMWTAANTPLIGVDTQKQDDYLNSLPSEFEIAHPRLGGAFRGLVGAGRDTAKTLSSFTTPLSIATLGLGALGKVPGAIGTLARVGEGAASAGFGAQGAIQGAEGASKIISGDVSPETIQDTLMGTAGAVGGAAGSLHSLAGASPVTASKINNRLIGTSKSGYSRGKDPGLTVAEENLTANSKPALRREINSRLKDLESDKTSALSSSNAQNQNVRSLIADPVNKAVENSARLGNEALNSKLQDVRESITGEFSPSMYDFRTKDPMGPLVRIGDRNLDLNPLGRHELKKLVGESTDWKMHGPEFKAPLNDVREQIYSGLDKSVDADVPGYEDINRRQSNLISAKRDLADQIIRDRKRSAFGMSDFLSSGLGLGIGAPTGHAIPVGLTILGAKRVLNSPAFQTRVASGLARPSSVTLGPGALATGPIGSPVTKTASPDDEDKKKANK